MIEAREAGDSEREPTSILVHVWSESIVCRRFAGWSFFKTALPRVPLAKPRSTLGFMLAPASRDGIDDPQITPNTQISETGGRSSRQEQERRYLLLRRVTDPLLLLPAAPAYCLF